MKTDTMKTDADMKNLIKSNLFRFNSRAAALSFAARAAKMMVVILGDDDTFWVVTPADGTRLLSAGYEAAQ